MTVSRRDFLKGAAGLAAIAMMPRFASSAARMLDHPARPILYGDGVHDDAPAIQALIDGEPVDTRDKAARVHADGSFVLAGGAYMVGRTIHMQPRGPREPRGLITSSRFTAAEDFEGDAMFEGPLA